MTLDERSVFRNVRRTETRPKAGGKTPVSCPAILEHPGASGFEAPCAFRKNHQSPGLST
jgi:hypothetical protein